MKVTLVYPPIAENGFNSFAPYFGYDSISHGLTSISAYAKKAGFDVDLIDLRRLKGWDHFRDEVLKRMPYVVGLTMMSMDFNPVMRCVDIIKEVDRGIVTVVGGIHPTIRLDEVATNDKIDHIITGEGEISFAELLGALEKGEHVERVITGIRPNLDELPFADRELFGCLESPIGNLPRPFVTIISGRGCTYNCSFCQPAERKLFGRFVRRRSVDNVIDELEMLQDRYHFRSFLIHDDCLTEDIEWIRLFCTRYKGSGFTQPFFASSRADIICKNEDVIRDMREAGLEGMIIGFESGSDRVLRFLRKGTTVAQNLMAGRICKRYGIKIWANYMMGIPTETKEEMVATAKMIREIAPDWYSGAYYTPYPGGDLTEYCEEHGLSLLGSHDQYRRLDDEPAIRGIDYDFVQRAMEEAMELSWSRRVLRRILRKLRRYKAIERLEHTLRGSESIRMVADRIRYKVYLGRSDMASGTRER